MKIKAVIFDVDGTLVDSESLHVAAWGQALKTYGHSLGDFSDEFLRSMAGKKPIVIAQSMVSALNISATADEILEIKSHYFLAAIEAGVRPMKGAIESVASLSQAGVRLAIGTSLDAGLLRHILLGIGLDLAFEQIVTGDMIVKSKPDPETYTRVIEKLGLSPDECVVVEDAQSGIESAKAAGTGCIALVGRTGVEQDVSAADYTIHSLSELTPLSLQKWYH